MLLFAYLLSIIYYIIIRKFCEFINTGIFGILSHHNTGKDISEKKPNFMNKMISKRHFCGHLWPPNIEKDTLQAEIPLMWIKWFTDVILAAILDFPPSWNSGSTQDCYFWNPWPQKHWKRHITSNRGLKIVDNMFSGAILAAILDLPPYWISESTLYL